MNLHMFEVLFSQAVGSLTTVCEFCLKAFVQWKMLLIPFLCYYAVKGLNNSVYRRTRVITREFDRLSEKGQWMNFFGFADEDQKYKVALQVVTGEKGLQVACITFATAVILASTAIPSQKQPVLLQSRESTHSYKRDFNTDD